MRIFLYLCNRNGVQQLKYNLINVKPHLYETHSFCNHLHDAFGSIA